ncbi:MAG: UDP-glucose 4-epimerase GalE [Rhabdochlamydiaceae bacterium]|nr:UDP-glucose 4-epimerase GalE [Rhabdochlamydiaceae bacterium]
MESSSPKYILVTGGAGYIGSYVNEKLHQKGYNTIVLDNLQTGCREAVKKGIFLQGDLRDNTLLDQLFTDYPIKGIMHFAGSLNVGESIKDPLKYYANNVSATINLLTTMHKHQIQFFVFSSTAVIFGTPQTDQIAENHPTNPLSPYGKSKAMVEGILQDLDSAYGLKYCCLRYFNVAGGDPKRKHKNYNSSQSNLIPTALRVLQTPGEVFSLFGTDYDTPDQTAIRDYIHIDDLASAHIAALEKLFRDEVSESYNLGNGTGSSVKEVLSTIEKITGKKIPIIEKERRAGDAPVYVANPAKAHKELGWAPKYPSIEEIILHTWQSM